MRQTDGVIPTAARSMLRPLPRRDEPELLDAPGHDPAELAANFRDIRRVNRLLGGVATTMRHLPALIDRVPADRPVTILDLATGSGDLPLAVVRWARRHGRPVRVIASDVDPAILDLAREHAGGHPEITFARHDARDLPLPDGAVDIAHCALSLHHFDPGDATRVLREMRRVARHGIVLNDLRRGRLGYAAAWAAARVTTRNRLTRNDAPLSVLRAYTPEELAELCRRAGIADARITTHAWFRMAAVATRERADA